MITATIRAFWHNESARPEAPIRSELFGAERLEQHAKSLAAAQPVTSRRDAGRAMMPRLLDNAKLLAQTYRAIVQAVEDRQPITPAAEWLLNNFHVIDEQIREIKQDLPPGYYRKLPKLAAGPLKGYPRIFGIAWAMTAHTDSAIDIPKLTRFIQSYQQVQPLTIGELWATSITLRITLVENLRRLAEAIAAQIRDQNAANAIADGILGTDETEADPRAVTQQRLERAPWSDAFALQLSQRLRESDPDRTGAMQWLTDKLSAEGKIVNQVAQDEFQRHGAMNVTVRNVITSMRLVSTVDWADFFEAVSPVDAVLRGCSDFTAMDFATRDLYRRRIEDLSHRSDYSEMEVVARLADVLTHASANGEPRLRDPGYYLLAQGRQRFEKGFNARVPLRLAISRAVCRAGIGGYIAVVELLTLLPILAVIAGLAHYGVEPWLLAILALVGSIPASEVAVALTNRLATELVGATRLPALALRDGIADEQRTIVVVPTLLTSALGIQAQVERLEVHYLANPEDNLFFALLSDWSDAASEHVEEDERLLNEAKTGIDRLNERYGQSAKGQRFYLLHRKRLWNASEGKWMGWERKRGKLHELNQLLRGALDTSYIAVGGKPPSLPKDVRYVITLDADTRTPMGTAKRLIGKMAHPLNRPRFDATRGVVVAGHAILQPRVTPSLPEGSEGSLFQHVYSGPNGIDPYAFAISDVYQDLFDEGSFVGKGIYDVDAFERAMKDRIPVNTVLSHDLLEGICARAGLVTDVEVIEEFPTRYEVETARQHRWARGDWQMLPWIFGPGRRTPGLHHPRPLSALGRWKLFDNLRRSLVSPATLLAFLLGWLLPLPSAALWTGFVLLTIALPPLLPVIASLLPQRAGVFWRNHLRRIAHESRLAVLQIAFQLAFLAHRAWLMLDAVLRTLYRLCVKRRLLEWVTAAQISGEAGIKRRTLWLQLATGTGFAMATAILVALSGHQSWALAAPFVLLWATSPVIALASGLERSISRLTTLNDRDTTALRLVARRTWRFFERFVTPEDSMLPPDNFQEEPRAVVAHRTSPTNLGLYLLSVIAARDFGWIGTLASVERLEETLSSMEKLERFRGHFYNWYDTTDRRTLEPKYVSTVDSGNLAGYLIAAAQACREMMTSPIVNPQWTQGLRDHLALIEEAIEDAGKSGAHETGLRDAVAKVRASFEGAGQDGKTIAEVFDNVLRQGEALIDVARAPVWEGTEVLTWAEALRDCVAIHQHDLAKLVAWVPHVPGTLRASTTLDGLHGLCDQALQALTQSTDTNAVPQREALEASQSAATLLLQRLSALADKARDMAMAMEFGFLFDEERQLFSIGYRDADASLDTSYYDLLASEARLASFFAIAKGDVPAKQWFRLGRTMTPVGGGSALISWSGSMFEYLMPSLVMRGASGSILEETNRLVVWRQIRYGKNLGVPWGISESEFNARDIEENYQYSSFGVPDLGYKRGLSDNLVIAPYATGLAAMFDPASAADNYKALTALGARGGYGWCEAIDFTPARLPDGKKFAVVRAYMAHHQAMTIVGILNVVLAEPMRRRFHAEAMVQAAELLLQERMPRDVAVARPVLQQIGGIAEIASQVPTIQRRYTSPHSRVPRTQVLSNGRFATMVTAVGSGYTRWGDTAITRWREDGTCDGWGSYIFLRDVRTGLSWSSGYQPSAIDPDSYDVVFAEDRAEITRLDGAIGTKLEVLVSPESDAEVRRITITNHGTRTREIELTSYAELVLARQADDVAHPAFGKLFVETSFDPGLGALLATRRRRSSKDPKIWAAHLAVVEGSDFGEVQFETDRSRFIGRGQTIRKAAAIVDGWPLSNTVGAVLDPIFSLRRRLRIPRGATVRVAFWTMAAATREELVNLADKHRDPKAFERAATLAWTQAQMQLRHLGVSTDEAHLFQRLANHVLYTDNLLRASSDTIKQGLRQASILWGQGISGDLPIILVRVNKGGGLELARQLLRAREYWRLKRIAVDLVILNEHATSYAEGMQAELEGIVRNSQSMPRIAGDDIPGSVFVLQADRLFPELRNALPAIARVVLRGDRGSLAEQLQLVRNVQPGVAPAPRRVAPPVQLEAAMPRPELEYFNGLGGFADNGREYVTILSGGAHTPVPWINVIANPGFGFQTSTDGSGFTWAGNSQQNQLTPWSNDPVCDTPSEVIYIRDEDSGEVWCPTALPMRDKSTTYAVHHGQGYTRFTCSAHGIWLELLQYVPVDDPIKISRLKIVNRSGRPRRLSVTAYAEWALGPNRTATAPFIVTEIHPATGAIFARNPWKDASPAVAFVDMKGRQSAWTADRAEFIGRDGALDNPQALRRDAGLSARAGAGLDPCAALQTKIRLSVVGETEVVSFLGQTPTSGEAEALILKYRSADLDAVLDVVKAQWDKTFEAVQVKTPDRSLDLLVNRWLLYQTLGCRVWARAGFYQASGAYGFRDQLQDGMALCTSRPDLTREHLLRAAGRQFVEGDVQHWWLPETGRGIRTRVSDDRGWLAYAVAHYVRVTGDNGVLDEMVPFLEGQVLTATENEAFFQPETSHKAASLFDHCALALDASMTNGPHGLPLMGTGDWNDGMDRVGGEKGESIWLGWFLYSALISFAELGDKRGRSGDAARWREHADGLQKSLESEGWDGDWYRRAYFDDGTPLGSVSNSECRIDSIAQSWSVISGAGDKTRAARAMAAVDKYLVRRDEGLIQLFSPPFDNPPQDPGYIKGYPPGIRENGGQYTHAAIWSAWAFALLGDGDRAHELLALLNPINHTSVSADLHRYRVEPYAVCADVYSMPPHVGRGGWTWYTGSAGWMYRVALEGLLGFRLTGSTLKLTPAIPRNWPQYEIRFRYRSSTYEVLVENPLGVCGGILALKLDGTMLPANSEIALVDDGASHQLHVVLG